MLSVQESTLNQIKHNPSAKTMASHPLAGLNIFGRAQPLQSALTQLTGQHSCEKLCTYSHLCHQQRTCKVQRLTFVQEPVLAKALYSPAQASAIVNDCAEQQLLLKGYVACMHALCSNTIVVDFQAVQKHQVLVSQPVAKLCNCSARRGCPQASHSCLKGCTHCSLCGYSAGARGAYKREPLP